MLEILPTLALIAIVALATRYDMLECRIPNVLCALALAAGLMLHALDGGFQGLRYALLGTLAGLAALLPFYILGGMGAGDVKLMAVIGSFLGPSGAVLATAISLMIGGVIGIGVVVRQRYFVRSNREPRTLAFSPASTRPNVGRLMKQRFPYAVAIAGGTLMFMWYQGQLDQLNATIVGWVLS